MAGIPPPTPLRYISQQTKDRQQRQRVALNGALAGAIAAQQQYDQGAAPPPVPGAPPPVPGAPPQVPGPPPVPGMAPPMGGPPPQVPGAAPMGAPPMPMAPAPMAPMGAPPMGGPMGAPGAPAQNPLMGGPMAPPVQMAHGGMMPAYAMGGPAVLSTPGNTPPIAPPNMAQNMPPDAPQDDAQPISGADLFNVIHEAKQQGGGPNPAGPALPNAEGQANTAPALFTQWLEHAAPSASDPFTQDIVEVYQQDPSQADELWNAVVALVRAGDPEVPPALTSLVQQEVGAGSDNELPMGGAGEAQSMGDSGPTLPDAPPPTPNAKGGRIGNRNNRKR